ncbi:hypothetical protein [Nonomuraea sp. SBT364]|uniref:hypothetical protein n=1 Tax=Nonomuraea sp. SBT364 TaxID=1580530 RepID=UPI00066EB451|nr:hypothetical protein [Nonomuraea sp. SBT364]
MTTILAPATADTSPTDQLIETWAWYTAEHQLDTGGQHLRAALVAVLLTRLFDLPADQAADLAWNGGDERVHVASDACEEMLDRIRRAQLTAQYKAWTPAKGDTVTWNGVPGTWIVGGYEDDDSVWIHRPDARMVPTVGRTDGMVDLASYRREPEHEECVAVADLRPVATTEVTV